LLVDDQQPFRKAARAVLAAMPGFDVVGEASSGEAAVVLADALRPDLVLLDIAMPGIGGIEAARRIGAAHPRTATLLVSTYREEDLPAEARTCGAVGYLHKSELGVEGLRRAWASSPRRDRAARP
jgi:two-component system, NarL family, invasion response regulator UvrY